MKCCQEPNQQVAIFNHNPNTMLANQNPEKSRYWKATWLQWRIDRSVDFSVAQYSGRGTVHLCVNMSKVLNQH